MQNMLPAPQVPDEEYKDHDRVLPIANIARIMKRALPENAKLSKDAKEWFIMPSIASERCITEKRKAITGDDIVGAMQSLGFDNYYDAMKIYLHKYKEAVNPDRHRDGHAGVNPFYEAAGKALNVNAASAINNGTLAQTRHQMGQGMAQAQGTVEHQPHAVNRQPSTGQQQYNYTD